MSKKNREISSHHRAHHLHTIISNIEISWLLIVNCLLWFSRNPSNAARMSFCAIHFRIENILIGFFYKCKIVLLSFSLPGWNVDIFPYHFTIKVADDVVGMDKKNIQRPCSRKRRHVWNEMTQLDFDRLFSFPFCGFQTTFAAELHFVWRHFKVDKSPSISFKRSYFEWFAWRRSIYHPPSPNESKLTFTKLTHRSDFIAAHQNSKQT